MMEAPRNMTGLYLSGFIQEGYLPPQERKSTIPSTLYRGHVVKLARAPNSNPHRSSVGRYPMHSLNSGFNGLKVPIKDQMNYKSPEKVRTPRNDKAQGKWTNYPMSIEIRKVAGSGASGSYLAECVLGGVQSSLDMQEHVVQGPKSRIGSSLFAASPTLRDRDEEMFYQSMYNEIREVVAHQEDAMVISRRKLQRILLNNSDAKMQPDVLTPAREPKRVATSYACVGKSALSGTLPTERRPHTTAATLRDNKKSALLLPVPYVSPHAWTEKQTNDVSIDRVGSFSPWLPRVTPTNWHSGRIQSEQRYNGHIRRRNSPEPFFKGRRPQTNIGVTSAERLNRLLNAAVEDVPSVDGNLPQEKEVEAEIKSATAGIDDISQANDTPHSALSVVVPALGEETPSLSCSPQPPRLETPLSESSRMEVAANDSPCATQSVLSPKVTNVKLYAEKEETEEC